MSRPLGPQQVALKQVDPTECPKFEICSAPICPLDHKMLDRVHRWGEPVCFYLRSYSKQSPQVEFLTRVPEKIAIQVALAYPMLIARHASLNWALKRSSATPQKGLVGLVDEA